MEFLTLLEPSDVASAILTGIITFLIFMAREIYENYKNRLNKRDEQLDGFRAYGYPLIIACESLVNRLHDMFQTRPRFLRKDAPDIEFYRYNYISTLYRLCAVLGWIRAIGREVSSLQVSKDEANQKLDKAISEVQNALASNHFTSGKQVDFLIKRWGLDGQKLMNMELEEQQARKKALEHKIENMVWVFLSEKNKSAASRLKESDQIELLGKIHQLLVGELDLEGVNDEGKIDKYRSTCISVVSRRVSWIYRDWQRAIGDFMLIRVEGESVIRRLELKPFHEFEEEYLDYLENPDAHRYLGRIDRLFSDLRPGSDAVLDVRSEQLRNVASKLVDLIEAIWETGIGREVILQEEIESMRARDLTLSE